jgi:hypothetical protein
VSETVSTAILSGTNCLLSSIPGMRRPEQILFLFPHPEARGPPRMTEQLT